MQLNLLSRYYLRRWATPLIGGLLFYGGLILAQELVQFSREIFSQGGAFRWLIPMLATSLPEILGMVLPMASVFGGLLGTQHLSEGSELVASQGLGVGTRSLLAPWGVLSVLLFVAATLNAHFLVPASSRMQFTLQNGMLDEAQTRFLRPGAAPYFPQGQPNNAIWMAPEGQIHLLEATPKGVQHLVAQRMAWNRESVDAKQAALILKLEDLSGTLYQRENASAVHLRQETLNLRLPIPAILRPLPPTPTRYLDTSELIRTWSPDSALELSRRLALPMASCALLLLGIVLGFGHPRFQRGGAILKSLGVILAYYMVMKFLETQLVAGRWAAFGALLLLPAAGLGLGFWGLMRRHCPHRSHGGRLRVWLERRWTHFRTRFVAPFMKVGGAPEPHEPHMEANAPSHGRPGVLNRWARGLWWQNWGATLGTLVTLNLLVEYATLAGDLSKNHIPILVFLNYWLLRLPSFLSLILPITFVFAGVLFLSEAALSREWTALKAGGGSLVQMIRASILGWVPVLLLTVGLQTVVAPWAVGRGDELYQVIRDRPSRKQDSKPWLYLGSTGVVWFLEGNQRWGFPLKPPGEAPVLLHWDLGATHSKALPWDRFHFVQGPEATALFPDRALRRAARAEESSTWDLFHWQQWAPDPERAAHLWMRLLGWLSGPVLLFAVLPFAFPAPRDGRGKALAATLVGGLLFLGAQAFFGGAARAGELPAPWGILAPMLLLLGAGLVNLPRLRT